MSFIDKLKDTLNEEFNLSVTENGAIGYSTTGKELLDLNFAVSSLRNESEAEVEKRFLRAFYEDPLLAVKWLFFAGDVRGGLGERRLFRIGMHYLAVSHPEVALRLLPLIPEYTRWDNYLCLLETSLCDKIVDIFKKQIEEDIGNMKAGKSVSLLAKWLPSVNATSLSQRNYAKLIRTKMGLTPSQYRKTRAELRAYLKVVEGYMSGNRWGEIVYENVPSRANLIYRKAFLRHDEDRRTSYLESLEKGETKINAGVLFPHDIVHNYQNVERRLWHCLKRYDAALEEMWKALPDYVCGDGTTICVADGSASMATYIGNTRVTALEVANALAIYFAERCSAQFKNKYITFSSKPILVDLKGKSLRENLEIAFAHSEVANTNVEAVFDLLLTTALKYKMKQSDIPKNILILSDMEFDFCARSNSGSGIEMKDFEIIKKRWKDAGYDLPRLVFWNIMSRTGTIPVKENKLGVALVSGFSPSIVRMVLSTELDPFKVLLDQLNTERYRPVEDALK